MTEATPDPGEPQTRTGRAALSKGLSDFIIELSIGVHRYAMYPPGHPSLGPAVRGILHRLGPLFRDRRSLNLGVARRQLLIEGVATDEKHPVVSDLARRLHELQLGAITFQSGVRGDEVVELLGILGREVDPHEVPIGALPAAEIPSWPHIRLHSLGYDRLAIRDEEGPGGGGHRATQLWLELAQAALAGTGVDGQDGGDESDPRVMADSIRKHDREAAYDQVIVGYMLQLAEELKSERGLEAERVRQRLGQLMTEMDESTLKRLVSMGGDFSSMKRFVLDANQSLAVDAVVKLVKAAATASRQNVSSSMTRLLSKLAVHADHTPGRLRTQARSVLEENVESLLEDWELEDPNPRDYTRMLDVIARSAPIFSSRRNRPGIREEELPGPLRVIQMAVEVDADGPTVRAALRDVLELGLLAEVLDLVAEAPPSHELGPVLIREVTASRQVRRYLAQPDVDEAGLDALARVMGKEVIPHFLDALATSDSRVVRRKVFDRLRTMGPPAGRAVLRRLAREERWQVMRNWLALLKHIPGSEFRVDGLSYLQHPDPRVRREALFLAVRRPEYRARALGVALKDGDHRVCRTAVAEMGTSPPEALLPTLVNRVLRTDRPSDVRALAVRAVATSRAPLVRDALMETVREGRSLLGRPLLADPDPAVLAALRVLATTWAEDPGVEPLLLQAAHSKDPVIRAAVGEENP